jgi:hypothetical protein
MSMNSNVARKLSDRILIDATKTMDLVAQSMMRDIAKEVIGMELTIDELRDRASRLQDQVDSLKCDFYGHCDYGM